MMYPFYALLCVLVQLWAPVAHAQDVLREPIDVERFKPALTHDPFVVTEGSGVRWAPDRNPLQLGIALNGALNPLVVVDSSGIIRRIVSRRGGIDLFGSLSLARGFALGVGLPLFVEQAGDVDPNPTGIGDLRIVPKIRLASDDKGFGVAIIPEIRLPTHNDDEFSGGARSAIFAPRLVLDHRFPAVRFGLNAGVLLRETTQYRNVVAASEVTYSLAAEVYFNGHDGIGALGVDFHGGAGLAGLQVEEAPLEGQLYVMLQPSSRVQVHFGPSMGLLAGYGTPTLRLYAGIRWSPEAKPVDCCPQSATELVPATAPEPTVLDPEKGLVRVKVIDSEDGEPIERSRARIDEIDAEATAEPGVHVAQVEPGDHELWVRARGYVPQRIDLNVPRGAEVDKTVPLEPIKITVTDYRIEFTGIVHFAFDSAALVRESHDLLDEVAAVLNAYPSIKLVRVEGHTDHIGSTAYNQRLSERRAASVMGYLVSAGVAAERLESAGFGESQPVSKIDSENRRVEFVILRGRVPGAKIFNSEEP